MMEKYNNPSKKKSFFMVIEFLLSYFTSLIKDTEITLQWFFEFMLTWYDCLWSYFGKL